MRLGMPKQLLPFKGRTLIENVVDEAISASLNPVVIVTGYDASKIKNLLLNKPVYIQYNEAWKTGMASGIVCGLRALHNVDANTESVILAVCDQPYICADLFRQMVKQQQQSGKNIVACGYAGTRGVPVLYSSKYFHQLQQLRGEGGTKKLLQRFEDDVAVVDFPPGAIDIDTMADYEKLLGTE